MFALTRNRHSLRYAYAGRPEYIITPTVAALELLCDSAGFYVLGLNHADGVVPLGVERLADAFGAKVIQRDLTPEMQQSAQLLEDEKYGTLASLMDRPLEEIAGVRGIKTVRAVRLAAAKGVQSCLQTGPPTRTRPSSPWEAGPSSEGTSRCTGSARSADLIRFHAQRRGPGFRPGPHRRR